MYGNRSWIRFAPSFQINSIKKIPANWQYFLNSKFTGIFKLFHALATGKREHNTTKQTVLEVLDCDL